MSMTSRPCDPASDFPAAFALIRQSHQPPESASFMHIGDLQWHFYQNTLFNPATQSRLWLEGAQVLGFACTDTPDGLVAVLAPNAPPELLAEMAAWAEPLVDRAHPAADGNLWLRVCSGDNTLLAAARAAGFTQDFMQARRLACPLEGMELPAAELPPNIELRAVGGSEEWAERVDLHRTVWHPSRVTLEAYQRLRALPDYRAELDLVATVDGCMAAYALCWYDHESRIGLFEPVGTHPAFRQRGLGLAVVQEGLRRLKASGARVAWVTAMESNQPSQALYQRAGFRPASEEWLFRRALAAA